MESIIYEFVGSKDIVSSGFVKASIRKCNIPENEIENVINLLCDRTFLGKEVSLNDFRFQYNIEDKYKIDALARKFAESIPNKRLRYCIHPAFHSYLEISKLL